MGDIRGSFECFVFDELTLNSNLFLMSMEISLFVPKLDKNHNYAVGIRTQVGCVSIIQSYETLPNLREGFASWYGFSLKNGFAIPVAVEKLVEGSDWRSVRCKALDDLMNEVVGEIRARVNN